MSFGQPKWCPPNSCGVGTAEPSRKAIFRPKIGRVDTKKSSGADRTKPNKNRRFFVHIYLQEERENQVIPTAETGHCENSGLGNFHRMIIIARKIRSVKGANV